MRFVLIHGGWMWDELCPSAELPRFFRLRLPASYVFLRNDLSAPREHYEAAAARLEHALTTECDGSHQAMQTGPEAVADALLSVVPQ